MKTMTCKQLYGPCDALIHGETSEEMMENSKKHAMEMVEEEVAGNEGAKPHVEAMEAMKKEHEQMDPDSVKQFMEKFQNDFASQSDEE